MFTKYYEKFKTFMKENGFFLCSLIAIIFFFHFELPYVVYTPGGAIDLSERVEVEGGYASSASFSMAYVSMIKGNIPFVLLGLVLPNWDVVSTKDIKPDNESLDEMIQSDQISLIQSQNNAMYAAFSLAGKEIREVSRTHHIVYLSEQAKTNLELFDEILTIDGQQIEDLDSIRTIISGYSIGESVPVVVRHDGKEETKYAEVYPTDDGGKIGVSITTTYEYETNPSVELTFKKSESGPSGGLMTALEIYNHLVEKDITGGKKIIGTGTILQDGTVGAIGGVKYKLLGAIKKKADIFLVPEENYEEALEVKKAEDSEIRIISVTTLQQAIDEISK